MAALAAQPSNNKQLQLTKGRTGLGSFPVTIMMKKIITTYLVLALMGCSASNDEVDYGTENTATAIRFATGMAPTITSRSAIMPGNSGLITEDVAGVQLLRDDNLTPFTSGITASVTEATIKAEYEDNKNLMSLNDNQYFKLDHSDAHFMAYYPAGSAPSGGIVNYSIDGSQDIITSNLETAKFINKREISFLFSHQLTLVRLQVKAENDSEAAAFGSLTKASIKVPNQLKLSIDASEFKLEKSSNTLKELSFLTNHQEVELKKGPLLIGELMIYPEQFNEITLAFTHKPVESFTLNWDSAPNLLKPGMINTITIDLKAFEIQFNASVAPWEAGNGEDGEEISIGGS